MKGSRIMFDKAKSFFGRLIPKMPEVYNPPSSLEDPTALQPRATTSNKPVTGHHQPVRPVKRRVTPPKSSEQSGAQTIFNSQAGIDNRHWQGHSPKPTSENEVLYRERRHFKFFLTNAYRQLLIALLLLVIMVWILGKWKSPPGALLLAILTALGICWYFIYRRYFEWKHLILEVNLMMTTLNLPEKRWLMLSPVDGGVPSSRVHAYVAGKKTLSELTIFRNCQTMTIDTQVDRDKESFHDMANIKNPQKLIEACKTLIAHYQHT